MIGKIKGTLSEVNGNIGLIETAGGVFYELFLTTTFITSTPLQSPVEIYTYLHVREDAMILFGFQTKQEYDFFKLLLGVPGVGPKTAFSVISFTTISDLVQAIKDNNPDYFTRIPGLGRKTALKIILELSSKLDAEFKMTNMYLSEDDKTVIDALVSLGFKSQEAKKMLNQISKDLPVEQRIKEGIKLATQPRK